MANVWWFRHDASITHFRLIVQWKTTNKFQTPNMFGLIEYKNYCLNHSLNTVYLLGLENFMEKSVTWSWYYMENLYSSLQAEFWCLIRTDSTLDLSQKAQKLESAVWWFGEHCDVPSLSVCLQNNAVMLSVFLFCFRIKDTTTSKR